MKVTKAQVTSLLRRLTNTNNDEHSLKKVRNTSAVWPCGIMDKTLACDLRGCEFNWSIHCQVMTQALCSNTCVSVTEHEQYI